MTGAPRCLSFGSLWVQFLSTKVVRLTRKTSSCRGKFCSNTGLASKQRQWPALCCFSTAIALIYLPLLLRCLFNDKRDRAEKAVARRRQECSVRVANL